MASRIREFFSSKDDLDYPSNYQQQHRLFTMRNGQKATLPVLELRVPMCCEKCQEKVKEELQELEGVKDVITDQYNQRVTVTGFVDPLKALRRVKKVKKKSEFFKDNSYINGASHPIVPAGTTTRANEVRYTSNPLVRSNSFGRFPHEGKMAPMLQPRAGERYTQPGYNDGRQHDLRRNALVHRQYEPRQQQAIVPVNLQRDFYGVRRMPSFKNYKHHDAEYISMGNEFRPTFGETHYVAHRNQRPVMRSQLSFRDIPVTNPYYMKHIESEYY